MNYAIHEEYEMPRDTPIQKENPYRKAITGLAVLVIGLQALLIAM